MTASDNTRKHCIIIALGTNVRHEDNMACALRRLQDIISDMKCSRQLWTKPIGIKSCDFMNMLLSGVCELDRPTLLQKIKLIEKECGRSYEDKANGIVKIDIDLLKYDDTKEHVDDWNRDYVKLLIKEL